MGRIYPSFEETGLKVPYLPVCEAVEVDEGDRRIERDFPEADEGTRGVDGDARHDVAQLRRGVVHEHAAERETLRE